MSLSAPRMWRCFYHHRHYHQKKNVCSTHVEMFPRRRKRRDDQVCLLHACGDVSKDIYDKIVEMGSAPRMWRCFHNWLELSAGHKVCSTHVEMFPSRSRRTIQRSRLLHACGDVSMGISVDADSFKSAPRMWRCFPGVLPRCAWLLVCSTHVEMFLPPDLMVDCLFCLLHACGDVSASSALDSIIDKSAPRMWRCF